MSSTRGNLATDRSDDLALSLSPARGGMMKPQINEQEVIFFKFVCLFVCFIFSFFLTYRGVQTRIV